ncbi:MAG TPA: indole-3-glycerol-phosphate synthase TrpC, partial [Myxococcota bacterium]
GINNRDLRSFETDLAVTERLAPRIPEGVVVVSESGIFTPEDVARLMDAGAHALLIGESLMREEDAGMALRRIRRTP